VPLVSGCTCDKARFTSRATAKREARRLLHNKNGSGGAARLTPYRCPGEGTLWHLTSASATDKAWHRRGERPG